MKHLGILGYSDELVKTCMKKHLKNLKKSNIEYKQLPREYVLKSKHLPTLDLNEIENKQKSPSPRKLGKKRKFNEIESKSKTDFKADSVTEDEPADISIFKQKRAKRGSSKNVTIRNQEEILEVKSLSQRKIKQM